LDDELEDDEPSELDFPPMPPAFDEVERRTIEPVDEVEVLGRTTEPDIGLFWNVSLEYDFGLYGVDEPA